MMNVNCAIFVPQPSPPTTVLPIALSPTATSSPQLPLVVRFDATGTTSANIQQPQQQVHYQNKQKMPQASHHTNSSGQKCPISFQQWSYMAQMRYQHQQQIQIQQQMNYMQQQHQQRTFFNIHQYQYRCQQQAQQQRHTLVHAAPQVTDETKSMKIPEDEQEEQKQQQQGKRQPAALSENVKKFKLQNILAKSTTKPTTTTTTTTMTTTDTTPNEIEKDAARGAATKETLASKSGNRNCQSQRRQSASKPQPEQQEKTETHAQQQEEEVVEKAEENKEDEEEKELEKDSKQPVAELKSKYINAQIVKVEHGIYYSAQLL